MQNWIENEHNASIEHKIYAVSNLVNKTLQINFKNIRETSNL